jgi:CspA family cold shock protein
MAKKIKGVVAQFGTKGYGFITGDDGEKYFVHQKNIYNKSRLRADTRVVFNAESSEKGLVATNVKLEKSDSTESAPLSDGAIKGMFLVLFIMQIIVAYKVFFSAAG